jgi:hypothetical protein
MTMQCNISAPSTESLIWLPISGLIINPLCTFSLISISLKSHKTQYNIHMKNYAQNSKCTVKAIMPKSNIGYSQFCLKRTQFDSEIAKSQSDGRTVNSRALKQIHPLLFNPIFIISSTISVLTYVTGHTYIL